MTLDEIALKCRTDKASNGHNYTPVYASYLEPLRSKFLRVFEIGIGGYHYPDRGGESLKMWYEYFPQALIVGVDLYEKTGLDRDRVFIRKGSQDDPDFLAGVVSEFGRPDLIIDDASHINPLTIKTFELMFPLLAPGGLYFCEDIHTSFWPTEYLGDPDPESETLTTLKFFQRLTAQLSQDSMREEFRRPEYAGYIDFIHFYRNLVIIKKK